MEYIALAEGLAKRKLIPASHDVLDYIGDQFNKDYYVSLYKYNEEHFKKFKTTKSLAGIKDVKTNRLVFDFDNGNDIEKAREDASELFTRLVRKGIPQDRVAAYFSGNKGFHIEVKITEELTRPEFKNIVFNLAGDLNTFDERINDEQRVIRAPLTMHQKTKLFKIPLNPNQLHESPIEVITEMARDPENSDLEAMDEWVTIDLPRYISDLKEVSYKKEKTKEENQELDFDTSQIDFRNCPRWISKERYALQEGFFKEGDRNHAFMILASTYRNQGFNKSIAFRMLKGTAELQAARTGEEKYPKSKLWKEIINIVYSDTWNGGIYAPDDELLEKTRDIFDIKPEKSSKAIITNDEMFFAFSSYATNIETNTIKTGLPLDNLDGLRLTVGMPVALLGAPGSGKTSVALNILRNTSKDNIKSLFFSMDMHKALVCQKQLHLLYGHSPETIFENVTKSEWQEKYVNRLNEEFGNVHYCTKAGLTIEQIRHHIEEKIEEVGDIKLVMIDYLECIRGPYSDPTANTAIIADEIKNIAVELDTCVILLVQPPKITGGAAYPLTNMYQIKGSSMIAQAMSTVIGIYREGFSPESFEDDRYLTFVGLKNRMGPLFKLDCDWNGSKGSIGPLTDEFGLEKLRAEIAANKEKPDDL